jgi:CDP-glucose 4,6-dehydratase
MGTVHVLEALKACSHVRAIVNVTTDKCYENKEWPWGYREIEPMGGFDPYSSSKGCSELITSAYRSSYFNAEVGLASARAGNVIGGGDWAQDRLIPDLVMACIKQDSLKIRYPHATRPWQHVLEPLSGYLCLAEHLYNNPKEYAESWNFGPRDTEARTVGWIADGVLKSWGRGLKWEAATGEQLHEATYLKLDCSKAATRLQWTPKWNIEKTLDATVSWYKAYNKKADMRAFTLAQMSDYMSS